MRGKDARPAPPMAGIRVLDFPHARAGMLTTMVLAELGADVVTVKRPGPGADPGTGPEPGSPDARDPSKPLPDSSKRNVALDLGSPAGQDIAARLAGAADVVVENLTPGVMARLGLDPATLASRNPQLIYCSVDGLRLDDTPWRYHSQDALVRAMGSVLQVTRDLGVSSEPERTGVADVAGALYGVIAILTALHERANSGQGRRIDLRPLDSVDSLLAGLAARVPARSLPGAVEPPAEPQGLAAPAFRASDGSYVQVLAFEPRLWASFCRAAGLDEVSSDPRFATHQQRMARRSELCALVGDRFGTRPGKEWLDVLSGAGVPCGLLPSRVTAPVDGLAGPTGVQGHDRLVSVVASVAAAPARTGVEECAQPAALHGQHTDEVIEDWLDCCPADIERLRCEGAFG